MSVEKDIVEELGVVLTSIRNAEKNIIGKDSSDKLEIVKRLVDLEGTVKAIQNDISRPALEVTENTLIEELEREKMLSVRSGNILSRSGCKTVGDITNRTVREITIMRNMGKKATDEIIKFLTANGFSLKVENE